MVWTSQSPSATVDFRPTHFVDIGAQLDAKLALLAAYGSQGIRRYLAPEVIRANAIYWSRFSTADFVEPLEVVRGGS